MAERDPAFVKGGPERDPALVKGGPPPPERDPAFVKGGPPPPERDPASAKATPAPTPAPNPTPTPAPPRRAPGPPRSEVRVEAPPEPSEWAAVSTHVPWRLLTLVGPALLCLSVHMHLDHRLELARALHLASFAASSISATLLARRLRRWWLVWGVLSPLVGGIPGLVLATQPTLEADGKDALPPTR